MNTSLRTQIILPRALRADIDRMLKKQGSTESLAEFLRRAARAQLTNERRKKTDLYELAREVVGAAKKSTSQKNRVVKWQRAIRRDRF